MDINETTYSRSTNHDGQNSQNCTVMKMPTNKERMATVIQPDSKVRKKVQFFVSKKAGQNPLDKDELLKKAVEDFSGVCQSVMNPKRNRRYLTTAKLKRNYPKPWLISRSVLQQQQSLQVQTITILPNIPQIGRVDENTKNPKTLKRFTKPVQDNEVAKHLIKTEINDRTAKKELTAEAEGKGFGNGNSRQFVQPWKRLQLANRLKAEKEIEKRKNQSKSKIAKIRKLRSNYNGVERNYPKPWLLRQPQLTRDDVSVAESNKFVPQDLSNYKSSLDSNANRFYRVKSANKSDKGRILYNFNYGRHSRNEPLGYTQAVKELIREERGYSDIYASKQGLKKLRPKTPAKTKPLLHKKAAPVTDQVKNRSSATEVKVKEAVDDLKGLKNDEAETLVGNSSSRSSQNHPPNNKIMESSSNSSYRLEVVWKQAQSTKAPVVIKSGEFHSIPPETSSCESSSSTDNEGQSWHDATTSEEETHDDLNNLISEEEETQSEFEAKVGVVKQYSPLEEQQPHRPPPKRTQEYKKVSLSRPGSRKKIAAIRHCYVRTSRASLSSSGSRRYPLSSITPKQKCLMDRKASVKRPMIKLTKQKRQEEDNQIDTSDLEEIEDQELALDKVELPLIETIVAQELGSGNIKNLANDDASSIMEAQPIGRKQPLKNSLIPKQVKFAPIPAETSNFKSSKLPTTTLSLSYTIVPIPHMIGAYKKVFPDGTESEICHTQRYYNPNKSNNIPSEFQVKSIVFDDNDLKLARTMANSRRQQVQHPSCDYANPGELKPLAVKEMKTMQSKNVRIVQQNENSEQEQLLVKQSDSYTICTHGKSSRSKTRKKKINMNQ